MAKESAKWALVTGSGKQRLGFQVAKALSARGYSICLHYRNSAAEAEESARMLRANGTQVLVFQADLSQEAQVDNLLAKIDQECGSLDVLVTCASTWHPIPMEKTTAADYRHFFESNILTTVLLAQKAGLKMAGQVEGGSIVTLGDWAVSRPYPNYLAYHTSKGGIPVFTRALAIELAARNPKVRVNCVEPGPVMLPPDLSPDEREEAVRGTLLRREGSPENIAQAVVALVENDYITGVCLPVDGGRTICGSN